VSGHEQRAVRQRVGCDRRHSAGVGEHAAALATDDGARRADQGQAASRLGVTQPRISDLVRGKIDLFSLDSLVNMVAAAGLHVEMSVEHAA